MSSVSTTTSNSNTNKNTNSKTTGNTNKNSTSNTSGYTNGRTSEYTTGRTSSITRATGTVDPLVQAQFDRYNNGYTQSAEVQQAYANLQNNMNSKPTDYSPTYSTQLSNIYNAITNGEKFNFDVNQSELYQNLKNQYQVLGQLSQQQTQGQTEQLSGGYGNSYAGTVGQQGYQNYIQGINDQLPNIYNMDLQTYEANRDDLYNQLNATNAMEDTVYQRYRDEMSDWQADRDYAYNAYTDERDYDYDRFTNDRDYYNTEYWKYRNAETTEDETSDETTNKTSYEDSYQTTNETSNENTTQNTNETSNENTNETSNTTTVTASSGGSGGGSGSGSSSSSGSSSTLKANWAPYSQKKINSIKAKLNQAKTTTAKNNVIAKYANTQANYNAMQNYVSTSTASSKQGYAAMKKMMGK